MEAEDTKEPLLVALFDVTWFCVKVSPIFLLWALIAHAIGWWALPLALFFWFQG